MVGSRSARRAFVAAVLGAATLIATAATPAAATELQSRVSGQGVTLGQADPNTVVSRDGGATWSPAYVVGASYSHPFDYWFPQANVSSAANWINCQPNFTACLNETVLYRTFIVLPNRPDLSLSFRVVADNAATPYINGVQAGPRFEAYGNVNVNPTLLHPGVNTFDMVFEDWGGLTGFRWELFGTLEASANPDGDHDGVPDPDGDSDGVPDATDNCLTTPNTDQVDTESDGDGNVCDDDDDNDGLTDDVDPDPLHFTEVVDGDDDGVADDDDNCAVDANADQADNDGDGQGDACDADDDDDGVADADDAFPNDPSESADTDDDGIGDNGDACPADSDNDADGDGHCGDVDNCPATANASQANNDGDGQGDACDADDDNDGVADGDDAFPNDPSESADTDGDGIGDNADSCPTVANADQADNDGDGQGDACDADDDNDGLTDAAEGPAGTNAFDADSDDDGVLDGADTLPLDPKVGTEKANAGGICSVVKRFATKNGAAVSLCNHLLRAQGAADRHDVAGFNQAMSVFDRELTAQTNGRNAAITTANAATIRALAALWTLT